ncbi:MAG: transcriptional regulator [Gammaproteobacteria bacterium]|nr:transcriptional regulator [Gammaproteobacteria bacterium]
MKEVIPQQRTETIRQELLRMLDGRMLPASVLSKQIGKPEKEIYYHLDQIKRTGQLVIHQAECSDCGHLFKWRIKVQKPSRCPQCKGTHIEQPWFSVALKER